ncbi:MAG: hypothetical protein R3Y51_08175 [Rikenellaceae bacterium]
MIDNFELVKHIKQQIVALLEENHNLKKRLENSEEVNGRLNKENFELKQKIKALNDRIEVLSLANSLSGNEQDRKEARVKVNKILREINDCIALINND